MGSLLKADCKHCGYNTIISIGFGLSDIEQKRCLWLFDCSNCNEIISANLMTKSPKCPNCKSRKIKQIGELLGGSPILLELDHIESAVLEHQHPCPKCNQDKLTIENVGAWD